ncbi:hypothetical protein [Arenimonas oryziterrae]|uniref:Phosphoglycerate mutase n=1 Tax=Arenimonas oryziterrae DSM 21050 = YC6267 TaxID=1121015 RepID=A0A091AYL8_9GAMM|nr:hypothetical protein [Arenimonas oryziterrae]KFN44511.1 hypothetical protein N789_00460 [Arenimonas oryziterrae DSM 21050 = YC6267]
MGAPVDSLSLLLPERRRFAGQALAPETAQRLGRADRLDAAEPGDRAQLLRYFQLLPRGWPMAAITRQADAGDAPIHAWLRADPVYVRPDVNGVRLMAFGNLGLTAEEAEAFIRPLKPLFGDTGFPISAGAPERWYLMLPRESKLPVFTTPMEGLGEDLLAHLPDGPEGRRWRALLNEGQILLHNHPRNAERIAAGRMPVNSLWFWGGGVLPDAVSVSAPHVVGDDVELRALATLAGADARPGDTGSVLVDLRHARQWDAIERDHLQPAIGQLGTRYASVLLDFADGVRWRIASGQRWRFWRRALSQLDA